MMFFFFEIFRLILKKARIAFDMRFLAFTDHERLSQIKIPKSFLGLCGINICFK